MEKLDVSHSLRGKHPSSRYIIMGPRRDDEPIIKFDGLWVRKQNTLLFFTFLSHFSFFFSYCSFEK